MLTVKCILIKSLVHVRAYFNRITLFCVQKVKSEFLMWLMTIKEKFPGEWKEILHSYKVRLGFVHLPLNLCSVKHAWLTSAMTTSEESVNNKLRVIK